MKTRITQKLFHACLACIFVVFATEVQAVNKYRSNGTGGGNWNATATWQLSTDGGTTWGAAAATPTSADDTIQVRSPDVVTNNVAVTVDQVTVDAGATLWITNGVVLTLANGTGTDLDVSGTLRNSGPSGSQITINSGATIVFETGSVYMHDFVTGGTIPAATWSSGSTCLITNMASGTTAPGGLAQSFWNFTWNCPAQTGAIGLAGALQTINGNYNMINTGTGSMRFTSTTVYNLVVGGDVNLLGGTNAVSSSSVGAGVSWTVRGNFNMTSGSLTHNSGASSALLIFDSNSGASPSSSFTQSGGTFNSNDKFNFIVGPGKTLTLNNNLNSGATAARYVMVTNNATLFFNGKNVTGSAAFLVASNGTLNITDANGITSTAATGNIQVTGTRTYDPAANYVYSGSAAQVTGNQLPTTVNNLTINNAGGVTLSGNVQVNGTMSMTAGSLALGGNTLSYGASGTLLYNGSSSQTTAAAEFPASSGPANLTITNSGGVTLNFARTLTGNLTLVSGNLSTSLANLLTIASTGGISGGSTGSYVNGPLARVYGATGSKNFPTGLGSFRQVGVNLTAISGTPTITVTPNEPSAWSGANTPASTTMFGTRDWTVNSSGAGNTASITVDGTSFSPAGAARIEVYDGTATTAYTPSFISPNYTATGIALASGNNEVALGDLACSAPTTPTFVSVTAPGCSPISVIWNAASGAATYDVFRKISGGSYPPAPLASGLTATNYSDSDVTNAVTYVYQIKASSACGASSLSADSTGVTATTAPFVTSNPVGYIGYEGFPGTFSVGARGDGLTYQWQVNKGAGFVNVDAGGADGAGGTTATFTTINATNGMNGYQYRCVVSGTCSPAATSLAATLTLGTQFRSLATGGWATNTSWQLSADGSTWINAPTGVYPGVTVGHTDTVRVQAAHTITVTPSTTVSAGAVTIDSTGKISLGDQASTTDANTVIQIAGNFVNNGSITSGQGSGNKILFNGTTTWTGSGDLTGAGVGKMGFSVGAGSTLNMSVDVTLRNSTGNAVITINGTLNAGTHFMRQVTASGSSSASLVIGPGATIETANPGGLGSVSQVTSGLFQSPFGTITIDPSANFIFDGITNQTATATATNGGTSTVLSLANSITIRNTGLATSNTVTFGSVAVSGAIYVQNGLISFGSTTTSTAGALTFDGSTYQTTGTWGNTGSAASNTDASHFAGTGYVTVSGPIAVTSSTQFRSHTSGNWNSASTWEGSADNGVTWSAILTGFTPGTTPGSTHKVYVQAGHTVTLTENESCNDINMSVGTTSSTTGGSGGKVACVTNTLSVNGQLRGYWAPVSTTPGTDQPSGSAFDPFTKTDVGGKIKIIGSGRVVLAAGQWGSYNITSLPASPGGAADWEFALTSGQTATNLSSFRPANVVIDSGTTLDIGANIIGACGNGGLGVGTGGAGNITISNGATLISSGSGVIARRTSTASSGAIGTFANQGTLKLSGAAPMIAAAAYDFSGGTVEYNGVNQTLLVKDSGTSGPQTDPTNYNHVTLSGGGVKSTPMNVAVSGTLNISSGTTLDFNGKAITVAGAPTLNGALLMQVTRTGANTFSGSQLIQTAGTLTYGGTLTVTNTGSTVVLGETIPLFNSPGGYGGSFGSVAFQPTPSGLTASSAALATWGNLTITCDGSLSASAAPNASICAGGSYSLNGSASAGGGGYTYSWGSSPAGFTSSSANPSVSPTATTTYNLTVTDANGCTAVASVTITVNPVPTTSAITGTNTVQQFSSATYSVANTAGSTYGWTVPAGASFTGGTGNSINVTFGSTSGNVSVVETNATGCTGSPQILAVTVITCTAPVIVGGIDPGATNVIAFNPVVFAVTNVTGSAPLAYQWRSNGVDIVSATNSSYTNLSVTVADAGNYQVVLANGCGSVTSSIVTLTVSKATPTATLAANNTPQTYDGTGKAATVSISSSSVPGTVSNVLTGSAISQTNAGTYAVTADFVPNDTANYETLTVQSAGNFVIQPVAASVTAHAKTKTYGDLNPTLTATVVGQVIGGDAINYSLATDAAQFSSVGVSNITVNLGSNPNYSILVTNSTLTIGAKAAAVTAHNASKVYGQTVTFAGTEFSASGFVGGDSVATVNLASAGSVSTAVVGSYPIVPSGAAGSGLGNYAISYTNGTLTVNPATASLGLVSSSNPSGFNDSLTFTANLTPTNASGTIQFLTNGVNFGIAVSLGAGTAVSGGASILPRGNNTITAVYSGDGNYLATTNALTQVVTNHAPVVNGNTYTRNGINTWKIAVTNLLSNASDVDGDTLTLSSVGTSTNGITLAITGGFVMYANTNLVDDEFSYTVTDGFGGTNSAVITLSVGSSSGVVGPVANFTLSGGSASMSFAGIPGYLYNVQVSTNLTDWNTLFSTNAPSGGVFDFTDIAPPQPTAYYRLMWNGN